MHIRSLTVLLMILLSSSVGAQTQNNDYYAAKSDSKLAQLLHNVEEFHLQLGIDQIKSRQYGTARANFDFILRYFPNHPRALPIMTELCRIYKDSQCNAEAYLDRAIKVNDGNASIYLIKGHYLQRFGNLDEAIDNYKKSLDINPNSANAHYNLGLAYLTQNQNARANEHAQKAYALGLTLPGLRNKLEAAGAWHQVELKPASEDGSPGNIVQPLPAGDASGETRREPLAEKADGSK